ncbi:terpene synthase family protein [Streptomyces sp. NPDC021100]|uniref:terpene synthase family protein n=1 Tax=Streptomyces sp. NPDC021100 TaxID=3365114 RepID=UPI0037B018DA
MRLIDASQQQIEGLYCPISPFPVKGHNTYDKLLTWFNGIDPRGVQRHRPYAELCAELTASTWPLGDALGQELMARWSLAAYSFDDVYCESVARTGGADENLRFEEAADCVLDVYRHPGSPPAVSTPVTRAMGDFVLSVTRHYSPTVVACCAEGWESYMRGLRWQIGLHDTVPSLADYVRNRAHNAAAPFINVFGAAISGLDLDDPLRRTPTVQALTDSGWFLTLIYNDWASRRNEVASGTNNINLVDVMAHEYHLTIDDAVTETVRLHDRIMEVFLLLADQCQASGGPLAYWARYMRAAVSGFLSFSSMSGRYEWPPQSSLVFTNRPRPDRALTPVPEPMRWWWDEAGIPSTAAMTVPHPTE